MLHEGKTLRLISLLAPLPCNFTLSLNKGYSNAKKKGGYFRSQLLKRKQPKILIMFPATNVIQILGLYNARIQIFPSGLTDGNRNFVSAVYDKLRSSLSFLFTITLLENSHYRRKNGIAKCSSCFRNA